MDDSLDSTWTSWDAHCRQGTGDKRHFTVARHALLEYACCQVLISADWRLNVWSQSCRLQAIPFSSPPRECRNKPRYRSCWRESCRIWRMSSWIAWRTVRSGPRLSDHRGALGVDIKLHSACANRSPNPGAGQSIADFAAPFAGHAPAMLLRVSIRWNQAGRRTPTSRQVPPPARRRLAMSWLTTEVHGKFAWQLDPSRFARSRRANRPRSSTWFRVCTLHIFRRSIKKCKSPPT